MGKVSIDEQVFTNIADAIRDRNEELTTYKPREMDEAIKSLHNVKIKKWIRPSTWPDYSQVEIGDDEEVIYLTYDCTYEGDMRYISIRVYGNYTIIRGNINNGVFVATSAATDVSSGTIFFEELPTNVDYIVYKITPQSGAHITRFAFARRNNNTSSLGYVSAYMQPCVERYCRIPNWVGTGNRTASQYIWSTRYLIADTIKDATPTSLLNAYNDGGYVLEKVDMSTCSFANITNMQSAFLNQYNISEVYFPHDLSSKCTNLYQMFYNAYSLVYLDLSGWDTSKVTRMDSVFYNCRELVEIKGIEDFDFTSATTMSSMFCYCRELKLNTSKWVTTIALTNINSLFYDCFSVTTLDVSGFNTENVTNFGAVFSGCTGIKEVDISNWKVTNKATSLSNMFGYCRKLEKLTRTKDWDISNVTTLEGMFRECRLLKEIDFSDFIPAKITTVRYMLTHCNSLQSLDLSGWDLTTITNKTNVTDFATNCWALSYIKLPDSTYMPGIGYDYGLHELHIPSSITTIADNSLRDLSQCEYIIFKDHTTVPTLNAYTDINNGKNTKLKIVVPDELYNTWIVATNWSNSNIVGMIINYSDYENLSTTTE